MEIRYGISKGMISLAAVGLLMVCTSTLMFVHNPLQSIIKLILNFSDGNIFFTLWQNPPYDIFLKIYIFNITNSEEFLRGEEKMNLTEIGPYIYREILTNENATFDDEEGTVTYQPHREILFDPERSIGDPTTDRLITTNLPLVGLQSYLNDASVFTNLAFSTFTRTIGSQPIVNVSIQEYLWGYDDQLVKYANRFIPSWIDFGRFGIFERLISRDNSNTVTIVKTPDKFHSSLDHLLTEEERTSQYHVARWNNLPGLKDWGFEDLSPEEIKKCHLVEGSFDGTVFPRGMRVNRTLTLFRKAFCRPVPLQFMQDTTTKEGFRIYEYKLADNMFDVTPENECFCYRNSCVKGFQSIAPCYYGIPITLSQPHYLNADPKYLDTVHGLKPDINIHGSKCTIQPDLGVPLGGNMRIQINLDVGETKFNSRTRIFNGLQIPLFWIEITTGDLPTLVVFLLHLVCNALPILLEIFKYLLGLGGLALISGSAVCILFKARVRMPGGISLNGEYSPIPIITIPNDYFHKTGKRSSIK